MSPRELSDRRIHEVREVLRDYVPKVPATDRELLGRLCTAVLGAIDVRDLRATDSRTLVERLEHVLATIRKRASNEIKTDVRVAGDVVVVESCVDDQPFLVSALRALFASEGLEVRSVLNAVLPLRRDADGILRDVGGGALESVIRVELRLGAGGVPEGMAERVKTRLELARAMVRDFVGMKQRLQADADSLLAASAQITGDRAVALREAEGLLRWLCDENFVIFSVEEYGRDGELQSCLGAATVTRPARDLQLLRRSAAGDERLARYERSSHESPVHRAGKPGHFVVSRVDRSGDNVGALVVDGLFTYKALHTPPEEIPYLRMMLRDLLRERGVSGDSHRGKSITNAFNSLPLEYLLTESPGNVWAVTDRVLRAEEEGGSDVHIQIGADRRFAFVFVTLPRGQFSEDLRIELQETLLGEFAASYSDYGVYIDRYDNAIVHFYVTGRTALPVVDEEKVRLRVHALAKGWHERLREALLTLDGGDDEVRRRELFDIYVDAFTEEHRRRAAGDRLTGDLRCLERVRHGSPLECEFFVSRTGDHPGSLNLRILFREPRSLSAQLPVIASFGFEVIDEYTRVLTLPQTGAVEMNTFRIDLRPEQHAAILQRAEALQAGIREVFAGRVGLDELNHLVARTGLSSSEVEILRAYVAHLHQLRSPFDVPLIRKVLVANPDVSRALIGVLSARFSPAEASAERANAAVEELRTELAAVRDYTADRVLGAVAELVLATVRTNCFVVDTRDGAALAFKVDGSRVTPGPTPKPFREIWVYGQDIEGVHLRGGKVARGGIRFSDRPDDFRTEIHGLMATQMVKNVLIVPVGAKGGFVLRHPPATRAALRAAGDRHYETFIRALLSVSDNVVDGTVVTPDGILHSEGDDPYLVVAADKGTAHLSDTANKLSMARGFWLDDAFASGGSNGYDHKVTAITARGAWEATKRSFRELGIDPETDPITAIGVGDMSGDVFGNGLLRSRTVKLLAAFNHMHVFVDPSPDPERSFAERKRLFELPTSTWEDYSAEVLSAGGGVWPRDAKSLPLSPEARTLLGVGADEVVSGDAAVRLILRLHVDLCWMGGIGTYVKSRDESHADVGDKANDSVRVDARDLGCRVLAEGANLSITDRGRVEFALRGGQNYTAFLDNSGGVDLSDHEVNIKILFAPLLATGKVTRERRNEVLRLVETEVCEMVQGNNRAQSRMVSYDARCSVGDLWRYSRTQQALVQEVPFDAESFSLPSEDELGNRARRHKGFHKCEAAVLGSHAKMLAYRELLQCPPLPEALAQRLVERYFPARIREAVGPAIHGHLLHREIATTVLVNTIVDDAGASFFTELTATTGRNYRDVAVAYMEAADFGDVGTLLAAIYALEDKQRQELVYRGMAEVQVAMAEATFFLLGPLSAGVLAGDPSVGKRLLAEVEQHLPVKSRQTMQLRIDELVAGGLPVDIAHRVEQLSYLPVVLDALLLARACSRSPAEMLRLRLAVADAMQLPALKRAIARMPATSPWDGPAVLSLSRQLEFHVHKMTRLVEGEEVEAMLERYALGRVRQQIQQFLDGDVNIAGIVTLDGQLRRSLPPVHGLSVGA